MRDLVGTEDLPLFSIMRTARVSIGRKKSLLRLPTGLSLITKTTTLRSIFARRGTIRRLPGGDRHLPCIHCTACERWKRRKGKLRLLGRGNMPYLRLSSIFSTAKRLLLQQHANDSWMRWSERFLKNDREYEVQPRCPATGTRHDRGDPLFSQSYRWPS